MRKADYIRIQGFSDESRDEFLRLVDGAARLTEVSGVAKNLRYSRASRSVVNRCDVLLALWDGGRGGGSGGTAETVVYAAVHWRPCIWISTVGEHRVSDNLEPGTADLFLDEILRRAEVASREATHAFRPAGEKTAIGAEPKSVLLPVAQAFDALRQFNEEQLPKDFPDRRDTELSLAEADSEEAAWVVTPYLRATLSAARRHRQFRLATWGMAMLAILAAVALAANVALGRTRLWTVFEAVLLAVLVLVFWYSHMHLDLHRRWLSYRLLAERLRSVRHVAPTGINFPTMTGARDYYVERHSAAWIERAFEEVWDMRPQAGRARRGPKVPIEQLRERLAEKWLQKQIDYHHDSAISHDRRERRYRTAVWAFFIAAVVAAVLHSVKKSEGATAFFSIVTPVAAASVGAVATVRQHRAQAERSRRMETTLAARKEDVLGAEDSRSLQHASADAARAVAEETGDWFGAMWFLDIEHPP
jgi:hypothetical protein